jgi:hypothetical protein
MLEDIRSFFEGLRQEQAPPWPEGVPAIDPATGEDLRALSELHWRLMMQSVDELETKIIDLYDRGADNSAALDVIDEVVAVIRRKAKPQRLRVKEIGQLLQKRL